MDQSPFTRPDWQPPAPAHPPHPHHIPPHAMPLYEQHVSQPQPQPQSQPQPQLQPQPPVYQPAIGHVSRHEQHQAVPERPPAPQLMPQPVVQVLSPRGMEYVFLTICLFIGAFGLGWALIAMVNGNFGVPVLAFPLACMVVAVPVFGWLFLRLKQAELVNPALRADPSKRRTTQLTQIISFITAIFSLVGMITALTAKLAGDYDANAARIIATSLVIFCIAGGILAYYWYDEH